MRKIKIKILNIFRPPTRTEGQIMVIAAIVLAVVLILIASMFSRIAGFLRFGSRSISQEQAINVAEAGVERALWQLNQTAGSYTGETDTKVGTTGTFTTTITNKTSSLKTITSTGYIPNSTSPASKQTIKVDVLISADIISFNYAVQVGTGGITMSNSATINGNVYSNKTGTNSILGFNSSKINGDAFAVGTISTPDPTIIGQRQENQPPSEMPNVDYQKWKDDATAGGTIDCSIQPSECNLTGNGTSDIGPKKYIGNLTVSNSRIVTMHGPVYVTGNVSVSNSAKIKLDQAFGSNGTVMVVDGTVSVSNSGAFEPTSANPKGYILVVTTSTSNSAVSISNLGVNAVFYALNGEAQLANAAHVTALVAKTLNMSNSATLDYDSGLASANFSSGPGGSWQIKKGTYKYK